MKTNNLNVETKQCINVLSILWENVNFTKFHTLWPRHPLTISNVPFDILYVGFGFISGFCISFLSLIGDFNPNIFLYDAIISWAVPYTLLKIHFQRVLGTRKI